MLKQRKTESDDERASENHERKGYVVETGINERKRERERERRG